MFSFKNFSAITFVLCSSIYCYASPVSRSIAFQIQQICDREYEDKAAPLKDSYGNILLHRPNHGTAHGVRQGFLSQDILKLIFDGASGSSSLTKFVRDRYYDSDFTYKIEMAAAFQRVGRESEAGNDRPDLYQKYMKKSREIFIQQAQNNPDFSNYFYATYGDGNDIALFANAITHADARGDSALVKKILDAAHHLDLVRMGGGADVNRIKSSVMGFLSINESNFKRLLERSRRYTNVTGQGNMGNQDLFVRLSKNHYQLVNVLEEEFKNEF